MANDLMNPPEEQISEISGSVNGRRSGSFDVAPGDTSHVLDALMGKSFEEKSIWADLYENIHEVFFPTKLPPLSTHQHAHPGRRPHGRQA